ncbi:hypothetical protein PCANC_24249 [Puccinia coronata f. sp. avenae]|uniref:Uncharacterized protein n=1 Tax=Puccinia coronata f. sp. avenae TaxID=200324 RepID=A0A2N5TJJ6_9BASI|nr:hypothetical protein PCANC_24249 [Puccinia coronata f. sp. avenae]
MSLCFAPEDIHRPHSTTPSTKHKRSQQYQLLTHSYNHSWSASTSKYHARRAPIPQDRFTPASHRTLPNSKRLAISSRPAPSSSESSSHTPPHLTPPSPAIRPSWLLPSSLTRTNSLPGKTHHHHHHHHRGGAGGGTPGSTNASGRNTPLPSSSVAKRIHTSPPPPLSRLPTSPTPASAVTGASGLTVSGRMVEYESDHCRREALSKVLRAVSQSGSGRSRHHHHHHYHHAHHPSSGRPSPSQTASSGGENEQGGLESTMAPNRRQEGTRRVQRMTGRKPSAPMPTSAPCTIGREGAEPADEEGFPFGFVARPVRPPPPGSQASSSGYISFASLNLLAPPSPPESVTGFLADDEHDLIPPDLLPPDLLLRDHRPIRLHLPSHNSPHLLNHNHLKT